MGDDRAGADGLDRSAGTADSRQTYDDLAEQRYRRLVDQCPNPICVHDGIRVVHVNPAGVRQFGAESNAQLVGHDLSEFVHPDSVAPMLERIALLRREGETSEPVELMLVSLDGTRFIAESEGVLTSWEGKPAIQVVFRDLTAQKAAQTTLDRYQAAVFTHVSDAIITTMRSGVVTSWNPAAEAIYGQPAAKALQIPVSDAVGASLDPAAIIAAGGVVHTTHHAFDAAAVAVRVSAAEMEDGYLLVCTDQTALRRAEQHFQTVVNSLDEGVLIVDKQRRVESANPAARRLLGIRADDLGGDDGSAALHLPLDIAVYDTKGHLVDRDNRPVLRALRTGASLSGEIFGVDGPDGERVWMTVTVRPLNPHDADDSALLLSFTDVTAQRTAHERLTHQATHDTLTGLPNRTHVITRVTELLDSGGDPALTAVLFIDLDNLKCINDSLGHAAGDEVLRIAAQRLKDAVRCDDVVARFGGDEFVALLIGDVGRPDLDHLADGLHATLSVPLAIDDVTLNLGASIGIVVVEENEQRGASEILRDADLAMYEAKTAGRGRTHHFINGHSERTRLRFPDEDMTDSH